MMTAQRPCLPLDGEIMVGAGSIDRDNTVLRDNAEDITFETIQDPASGGAQGFSRADSGYTDGRQPIFEHGKPGLSDDGLGMLRNHCSDGPLHQSEGNGFSKLVTIAGFLVAAAAFWINGGYALFSNGEHASQLIIADVSSSRETLRGMPVLRLQTRVENRGRSEIALPVILVDVHGMDGSVKRYKLGTSRDVLKAGGSHLFSGQLSMPKTGVERLSVSLGS